MLIGDINTKRDRVQLYTSQSVVKAALDAGKVSHIHTLTDIVYPELLIVEVIAVATHF